MSFGVDMFLDAVSLLRENPDITVFEEGTVLFFGFDKFKDRDKEHAIAFESKCKEYTIEYTALEFSTKPSLWLYGRCYTIKVHTIDDFQKATPIIEAFGGSTERFLLKSADVRLTKMDELIKAHLKLEQVCNLLVGQSYSTKPFIYSIISPSECTFNLSKLKGST